MVRDIAILLLVGLGFLFILLRTFYGSDMYSDKELRTLMKLSIKIVISMCLGLFGIGIVEILYILTVTFLP